MKAIIIGCGRVGSAIAVELDKAGWDVTAVDEKEDEEEDDEARRGDGR